MIFASLLFTNPTVFCLVTLAVIPAISLHEYFHAQVALWCGDPTAAMRGHLTLNPLKQMGPLSIITFLLIGIAWGGVPVNPYNLNRRGRLLTSFAGPGMNFFLFLLAFFACPVLEHFSNIPDLLKLYVFIIGVYNLILFMFNILPIPGLDGWNILTEFVKFKNVTSEFFKGVMILLIFGLLMFFPYLTRIATIVMDLSFYLFSGGN